MYLRWGKQALRSASSTIHPSSGFNLQGVQEESDGDETALWLGSDPLARRMYVMRLRSK